MNESQSRARSEVVRVDEAIHLPLLRDFIREVWTPSLSLDGLRAARAEAAAANPANPGEPPPTFLFLSGGRAIGHLSTIPTRLRWNGWEGPAHWLKGFWVLPEHRNGPVGAMLVRQAARELDCLLASVVDRAPLRVFEAFKLRDFGKLTDYVRILRPERVLARVRFDALEPTGNPWLRRAIGLAGRPGIADVVGGALRVGFAAYAGVVGRSPRVVLSDRRPSPEALDLLWRRVAESIAIGPVRDAAYFDSAHRPEGDLFVAIERGGTLEGWARVRRPRTSDADPRLAGIAVATLADLVIPPDREDDGLALLRAAEYLAREAGADALLCGASHSRLKAWLERRAFLPVGSRVHFAARGPAVALPSERSIESCWITRADGGADEAF